MSNYPKYKKFCSGNASNIKKIYPISYIISYGNGVIETKRSSMLQGQYGPKDGRNERKITMLTDKSLSRMIATIQATDVHFRTMITLTYPKVFPDSGAKIKQDLNAVLSFLKSKSEFEYFWFLEFQARGAPHFHILTTHNGITPRMRIDLAECWTGRVTRANWFMDEMIMAAITCKQCEYKTIRTEVTKVFSVALHESTWEIIRSSDGAKKYVTKYAQKPEQKEVPEQFQDVGRFWGCSQTVKLGGGVKKEVKEDDLLAWLKEQEHPAGQYELVPKFLYGVKGT